MFIEIQKNYKVKAGALRAPAFGEGIFVTYGV